MRGAALIGSYRSSVPIGQRFEAPVRSPPFYGARWNAHGRRLLTAHAPAYYRLAAGFTWKPSSISTCDRWATALTRVFAPAASAIATAARRSYPAAVSACTSLSETCVRLEAIAAAKRRTASSLASENDPPLRRVSTTSVDAPNSSARVEWTAMAYSEALARLAAARAPAVQSGRERFVQAPAAS